MYSVHGSAGKKAVLVAPTLSAAGFWIDIYRRRERIFLHLGYFFFMGGRITSVVYGRKKNQGNCFLSF
jgi:hypothetical protein